MRTSIEITGLETYAYHGLFDEEQRLGQKFSFDIAASIGVVRTHNTDDLAGSVRYDAIADTAAALSTARKFRTLEALGEAMAVGLLGAFPALENISIGVRKFSPPIVHHLEKAGVTVSLSRAELNSSNAAANLGGGIEIKLATPADLELLRALIEAAIDENLGALLSPRLLAASRTIMGLDTQLIADGTYWVARVGSEIAGCGGWSHRATLYGGDEAAVRDAAFLDPRTDPARIRAMYTHPNWVRRGVGRAILAQCERAAAAEGFSSVELVATVSGEPLYRSCGYREVERFKDQDVPLLRMSKQIRPEATDISPNEADHGG